MEQPSLRDRGRTARCQADGHDGGLLARGMLVDRALPCAGTLAWHWAGIGHSPHAAARQAEVEVAIAAEIGDCPPLPVLWRPIAAGSAGGCTRWRAAYDEGCGRPFWYRMECASESRAPHRRRARLTCTRDWAPSRCGIPRSLRRYNNGTRQVRWLNPDFGTNAGGAHAEAAAYQLAGRLVGDAEGRMGGGEGLWVEEVAKVKR